MKADDVVKQGKAAAGGSVFAKRLGLGLICLVVIGGAAVFMFFNRVSGEAAGPDDKSGTFTARRGDLTISVTENGDIKALDSIDVKSKVEGKTTIISLVDEGTVITPEDVNNGKILVELDSSEIKEKLTQQEIKFLDAEASVTDAKEALDIQKKQNDSDIQAGKMKVRFALIDLQKYLGEVVSGKLVSSEADPADEDNEIGALVNDPELGGEALQKLRDLDGDIYLKEQRLQLAKSKYEWTEKLYEKKYVSLSEKQADQLDKEQKEIGSKQARTAKELFVRYEFPKAAQQLLSDYNEAKRELERIEAKARSKLAQAEAKLESEQATYSLQKERLERLQKQFEACTIRAPAPGEVVYGSSLLGHWRRQSRMIEVGGTVRERQTIISIPDTSKMKVEVKIHENWIDKVEPSQKAIITVAAFPGESFAGEVLKKAPLADPEQWMNPDLKVYTTDVSIDGTHEFLKTGMTAKVEVIIEQLKDVISVPIQSVVNVDGKKVCLLATDKGPRQREVETGLFNNDFVEIKSGLAEGEKVLLSPPRLVRSKGTGK